MNTWRRQIRARRGEGDVKRERRAQRTGRNGLTSGLGAAVRAIATRNAEAERSLSVISNLGAKPCYPRRCVTAPPPARHCRPSSISISLPKI